MNSQFSANKNRLMEADEKVEDVTTVMAGTVFETAGDPRLAALPVGTILLDRNGYVVVKQGKENEDWSGIGYFPIASEGDKYGPWTVDRLPKNPKSVPVPALPDTSDAVPENTLTVGSVWRDADALIRACKESGRNQIIMTDKEGRVGVWDTEMKCWRVSAPYVDFAPFTIIHDGKKADQ